MRHKKWGYRGSARTPKQEHGLRGLRGVARLRHIERIWVLPGAAAAL